MRTDAGGWRGAVTDGPASSWKSHRLGPSSGREDTLYSGASWTIVLRETNSQLNYLSVQPLPRPREHTLIRSRQDPSKIQNRVQRPRRSLESGWTWAHPGTRNLPPAPRRGAGGVLQGHTRLANETEPGVAFPHVILPSSQCGTRPRHTAGVEGMLPLEAEA